jgi:hypothetical protein
MTIHAATRRELLGGAGVLFAWPFLPKIARAEGRGHAHHRVARRGRRPAAVALVGDPDWASCGDKAVLDGRTLALPLDPFCSQSRDAKF